MKFPHFSRMITAPFGKLRVKVLLYRGVKLTVLAVLTALLLAQLYPANSLTSTQAAVLVSPADVSSHLLLSQEYLAAGKMEAVERELTIAQSLTTPYALLPTTSVLGTTLSPLKILEKIKAEPQQIREEISFWEKVVAEKPGYRDAYLQLTVLNYKIYQTEKAKKYLEKAKEIDPNYEKIKEIEKMLR